MLTATFQISSTVNLVAALGSSYWMMGSRDRGLEEIDRMIGIARDMNHPSALSNALGVACYMLTFHHDFPRMLGYAEELKSFAREEGWELWFAVGVMSSGWSRLRMGDREGLGSSSRGSALFGATRSDLMGPTVAVIHGEGLRAAGRRRRRSRCLPTRGDGSRGPRRRPRPGRAPADGRDPCRPRPTGDGEAEMQKALETAASQKSLRSIAPLSPTSSCSSRPVADRKGSASSGSTTSDSTTVSRSPTSCGRARCWRKPASSRGLALGAARRVTRGFAVRASAGGGERRRAGRPDLLRLATPSEQPAAR